VIIPKMLSTILLAPLVLGRVLALPNHVFRLTGESPANTSEEAFYAAPPGFESTTPGTILKYRRVPQPIAVSDVQIPVDGAWQLLYRTQDSLGKPDATMMTILKPKNAKPKNLFSESFFTV
jgi:hypothetical protein